MTRGPRWFVARHGETVFNAARRLQGEALHTPLTRAGFAQADAMGAGLARWLAAHRDEPAQIVPMASDSGRALQTLAIVCEHLALDWHAVRGDRRLREIDVGSWGGKTYAALARPGEPLVDPETGLFAQDAPGGESYADVADRLADWIADMRGDRRDRVIVMHGMSSRVLRAMLTGLAPRDGVGVPVAAPLPQGSVAMIAGGRETVVVTGTGRGAH